MQTFLMLIGLFGWVIFSWLFGLWLCKPHLKSWLD